MNARPNLQSLPAGWQTRAIFEVRGHPFTILDAIRAAEVRGDLSALIACSVRSQICERLAAAAERVPDMEAVEAMMDEFRYARGLVTVEETERWLTDYDLTPNTLSDYFLRRHWVNEFSRREEGPVEGTEVLPHHWAADLAISGELLRLAHRLARESACARNHPTPTPSTEAELLNEFQTRRGLDAAGYASWRADWDLTDASVATLLFAQRQFARDRQDALTPERRTAALAELRTALNRVELLTVQFDSEAAAHEAYLCVTADGMKLEDVASETGYPIRSETAFLRQFPEDWQFHLLGAIPGRTLPPLAQKGTYDVCRVISHSEPQLSDPEVLTHLDAVLLERQFGQLEANDVRWLINAEVVA